MADTSTHTTDTDTSSLHEAEAAVEQSREQLAATVRALHERTDVKGRAGRWSAAHRPALLGTAGGVVVLVAVLVVVRRRR